MTTSTTIPIAAVRAALAERQVERRALAQAANLSNEHVSRVLVGSFPAGELTVIKIRRGLRLLGITVPGYTDVSDLD